MLGERSFPAVVPAELVKQRLRDRKCQPDLLCVRERERAAARRARYREAGRAAVKLVEERVRAGLPPRSVVSVTGLPVTPAVEAMRGGAQDYLIKRNTDARSLAQGLRHAIERKRAEDALQPLGLMRRPRADKPRRPRLVYFAAAATLVAVGFLIGQATTSNETSIDAARTVRMHGVGEASTAAAVINVGRGNDEGNWSMLVSVRGLRPAPKGTYYDLWLSANGKPKYLCGTFNTKAGAAETVVRLSAAYPLQEGGFDGWIVTWHKRGQRDDKQSQLMMTT